MFFVYVLILVASVSNVLAENPNVVVLSFVGINDFLINRTNTPNLMEILDQQNACGSFKLQTVYPSKTVPAHNTIATGVYPCFHGVYNDKVFDSQNNEVKPTQDHYLYKPDILPIWIENQKKGNERYSGVMMWPGGEFEYSQTKAEFIQTFDSGIDWSERVKTIESWMTGSPKKANLVLASFENYTQSHNKKTEDALRLEHIQKIDRTVKDLYDRLKAKMQDDFHLIVLSDHGMQKLTYENVLSIESCLKDVDVNKYQMIAAGSILFIKPIEGEFDNILLSFDGRANSSNRYLASSVNDLNDRLNLGIDSLAEVIIVNAYSPNIFFNEKTLQDIVESVGGTENFVTYESGYDYATPDMNAFFAGIGKHFIKEETFIGNLEMIDVYVILKCLLEMPQAANEVQKVKVSESVREILNSAIVPEREVDKHESETSTGDQAGTINVKLD